MENLFSNVKPKTKDLYFANLQRLNGGKDIDINNLDFLEDLVREVVQIDNIVKKKFVH